ncbi:hypothetical protein B0H13DRAFT_2371386 [Mycena leptocephala]|nr:hypothetical protein B0H13DRAFT_2371386 [Mycena leptocephala]
MFSFYLHVLRKNDVVKNRFLTIATISLFLLCTVYCALLLATTEIANIFRCYAIWNFRWNIVILPIVMTIIGAAFGYLNVIVFLQTTAVFDPLYATFSGGLPAFLFTFSISFGRLNTDTTTNGAILGQLVGIAPTIIVVRAGLGQSIESVDSFGAATPSHAVRARRQLQSAGTPAAAPSTEQPTIYLHADHDKAEAM